MTTSAPITPPPSARPIWSDGRDIYMIIPGPNGPVQLRYPLTNAGLSSALGVIRTRTFDTSAGPAQPSGTTHKPKAPDRRDAALAKLRSMGLRI